MRGVSRTSLAEVEERFNSAAGSADFGTLADDLFAIADLLDREHGLRRAVADPTRPAEQKAQIMRVLLEGKVCAAALETAVAAANLMVASRIRHLPVVDDGRLVGMVDIVDACRGLMTN